MTVIISAPAPRQAVTRIRQIFSTAANMACAAIATAGDAAAGEPVITTIATAGVSSNATRAGDPTRWSEEPEVAAAATQSGTIVLLVHCSAPLRPGAMATAAAVMTEAKSTVLLDLRVPSCQSGGLATGTGTDQFVVLSPRVTADSWPRRWAGTHSRLGELWPPAYAKPLTKRCDSKMIYRKRGSAALR